MNFVALKGRIIPNTEKSQNNFVYREGNGDKRSVLRFIISVQKPYGKKDENGYYPSVLFNLVAFGQTADFVNRYFKQGDQILISRAHLDVDPAHDDPNTGTHYPARTIIIVDEVEFCSNGNSNGNGNGNNSSVSQAAPTNPVSEPMPASNYPF